jgi:2-methylisocitrate lyase-like PEP mutase family enzyme
MTGQTTAAQRASTLLELHQPGNPVVLPTVWDAWSARLAVDAGFAALTVGSHPLADSIGKPDGEGMSFDDVVTRLNLWGPRSPRPSTCRCRWTSSPATGSRRSV